MTQANETNDNPGPIIGAFCSRVDSIVCQRIVDALRESNFNISLNMDREENDKDKDQDEEFSSMANMINAMDGPSIILVFISRNYSESDSFSMLLTVSSMEGKPLLPIIIEKDFEPVGSVGLELARHSYVRWHDDTEFSRFINDVKKHIRELLPLDIPTASDCDILAEFDAIIALFDNTDSSKVDVDKICQSICVCMKSTEQKTEDSKTLLPIAVEIFLKYNVILGRIDDRFVELTKQTGMEIYSFLDRTIENAAECNPFVDDHKRARETFSRIFNSLATFPTTIYFLNDDFMLKVESHARILFWGARVLQLTCFGQIFNSEQDAAKFPEQQIVLQMWLKYIDKSIQMSSYTTLVDILMGILGNLSANVSLVPLFVDACFPSTVLSWLSRKIWNINETMIFRALCMVYNFARHDKGAEALNLLGATELLKRRRDVLLKLMEDPDASTVFDITLALLYQPESINDETLKIEPILKELLSKTLSTSRDPQLRCGILPLSEFFLVFNTLFVNEEPIRKSLEQTVDDKPVDMYFFPNFLMNIPNLDGLSQTLLLNIIYRMTSITTLKHELAQNQAFVNKLKDLKSQNMQNIYLPKHTVNLLVAVNGILRNLGKIERSSEKEALLLNVFPDHSTSVKKKVMVSYSHENHGFCKALVDSLKNSQLSVWVDYERLDEANGDPHDYIVRAMSAADKVICILTKDYFASEPCKSELGYAISRLKLIENNALIPIHIGKKYKPPDSWDYRMINIQYIRFNEYAGFDSKMGPPDDNPSFKETIQKLRHRVLHDVKEEKTSNVKSHYDAHDSNIIIPTIDDGENSNSVLPVTAPTTPLLEWKKEDIAQWLASIPVSRKLTILYKFQSVEELLAYARDLKEHEDINYTDIKDSFNKKYGSALQRMDFLLLRNAFEQLLKSNLPTNELKTQTITRNETAGAQSRFCALM